MYYVSEIIETWKTNGKSCQSCNIYDAFSQYKVTVRDTDSNYCKVVGTFDIYQYLVKNDNKSLGIPLGNTIKGVSVSACLVSVFNTSMIRLKEFIGSPRYVKFDDEYNCIEPITITSISADCMFTDRNNVYGDVYNRVINEGFNCVKDNKIVLIYKPLNSNVRYALEFYINESNLDSLKVFCTKLHIFGERFDITT